jgi:hypothetical protein
MPDAPTSPTPAAPSLEFILNGKRHVVGGFDPFRTNVPVASFDSRHKTGITCLLGFRRYSNSKTLRRFSLQEFAKRYAELGGGHENEATVVLFDILNSFIDVIDESTGKGRCNRLIACVDIESKASSLADKERWFNGLTLTEELAATESFFIPDKS